MPSWLNRTTWRERSGVTSSVYSDAVIDGTLNAVETQVRKYLGFSPQRAAQTSYYNGTGTPDLVLAGGPLASVASVYVNWSGYAQSANFTSETLLTVGTDYYLDQPGGSETAILRMIGGVWPFTREWPVGKLSGFIMPNPGSVKVTHTSGLAVDDLAAIVEAGYLEATAIVRTYVNPIGSVITDSMDGASVSVNPFAFNRGDGLPRFISAAAEILLQPFRRVALSR